MATGVRDSARTDYYAVLGVDAGATDDEITQAFRARAKLLHPDTTTSAAEDEQFKELSAAYAVLSNADRRRAYDRTRVASAARPVRSTAGAASTAPAREPWPRWSHRRAWTAVIGGVLVALLGVLAACTTWILHDNDAAQRARYVPVVATRVDNGSITFTTRDGRLVTTREPEQHGEGSGVGPTVNVRYDPSNPRHVIVDANTLGRDITLGIVALKLMIAGPVFVVLGWRRLRRLGSV
ncbi:MAG TPA: DnaJ domain-containing protein [Acidimicrobiia bacterium]|nr:DnaJ domain-containing protein [Acidimicrobiia bacterium]